MTDPLTVAELKQIGERSAKSMNYIACEKDCPCMTCELIRDRARLYAALERMIVRCVVKNRHRSHFSLFLDSLDEHPTSDAAIDALLQGGG